MVYLAPIAVVASVRSDGSHNSFQARTFDLMLDQEQPESKQLKEAKRILCQIGYEARGVKFAMNPGN